MRCGGWANWPRGCRANAASSATPRSRCEVRSQRLLAPRLQGTLRRLRATPRMQLHMHVGPSRRSHRARHDRGGRIRRNGVTAIDDSQSRRALRRCRADRQRHAGADQGAREHRHGAERAAPARPGEQQDATARHGAAPIRDVARANPAESSQRRSQQARTRSHNRGSGAAAPVFVYETGHAAAVVVTGLSCARQASSCLRHSSAVAPAPKSTARDDSGEGWLCHRQRNARPPARRAASRGRRWSALSPAGRARGRRCARR